MIYHITKINDKNHISIDGIKSILTKFICFHNKMDSGGSDKELASIQETGDSVPGSDDS